MKKTEEKSVKEIKQPVSQPIRLHQFYFIDIFIIICFYISNARHAPSKSFQVCMLFFFLFIVFFIPFLLKDSLIFQTCPVMITKASFSRYNGLTHSKTVLKRNTKKTESQKILHEIRYK